MYRTQHHFAQLETKSLKSFYGKQEIGCKAVIKKEVNTVVGLFQVTSSFAQNRDIYKKLTKSNLLNNKIYKECFTATKTQPTLQQNQSKLNVAELTVKARENAIQRDQQNIQHDESIKSSKKLQTRDTECQTNSMGHEVDYDSNNILNSSRICTDDALNQSLQLIQLLENEVKQIDQSEQQ